MNKKSIQLICFIFLTAFGSHGFCELVDRIVAIVNDDAITLFELEEEIAPYAKEIRSTRNDSEETRRLLFKVRQDILNSMIERKLADQESKRLGISVSDAEVDSRIERIKSDNFFTEEDLKNALASQGYTFEEYKKRIKSQILQYKIINREVKSKIAITEAEIQKYMDSHQEAYSLERKYHLRSILIRVPSWDNPEDDKAAVERVKVVLGALRDTAFDDVARQYSEDASAENGGDLGFFFLNELTPELQETVRWMKEGDTSAALQTPQGYQIIHVEAIEGGGEKGLNVVKGQIEEKLFQEKVEKQYKIWLKNLRERSFVKTNL